MKSIVPSKMFWLVWNEQKNLPVHKHWTLQEAKAEAHRLATTNQNCQFHVLGLLGSCAYSAVVWSSPGEHYEEEGPF